MSSRSGLGWGLSALIPSELTNSHTASAFRDIPLSRRPAEPVLQPREHFDEEAMSSLAASIREPASCSPSSCGKSATTSTS